MVDFIYWRLICYPLLRASADELWVFIQRIWNALQEAGIHNLIYSIPHHIAELIATCGDYSKYLFWTHNIAFFL